MKCTGHDDTATVTKHMEHDESRRAHPSSRIPNPKHEGRALTLSYTLTRTLSHSLTPTLIHTQTRTLSAMQS